MKALAVLLLALVGCATADQRLRGRATDPPAAGMAVIDEGSALATPLGPVVEEAVGWWARRYPARAADLRSYLARGSIIVVAQAQCPMASDPWYPPVRPVWGESRDNVLRVCHAPNFSGEPFNRLVRHELGHAAAAFLYRERNGAEDHAFFQQIGYPWP